MAGFDFHVEKVLHCSKGLSTRPVVQLLAVLYKNLRVGKLFQLSIDLISDRREFRFGKIFFQEKVQRSSPVLSKYSRMSGRMISSSFLLK